LVRELTPLIRLPSQWNLTPHETKAFRLLLTKPVVTRDIFLAASYHGTRRDEPSPTVLDVHICRMREKLRHFGIEIRTKLGEGYYLERDMRERAEQMIRRAA
jgi:DNA-binding response OmpR family regulator